MRTTTTALAAALIALAGVASAEPMPRTGSISFHTGWHFTGEVIPVAEKTMMGHGRVAGVTFNDRASGPLHLGPANCFDTFVIIDGRGRNKGACTFSDADGDRIFTEFDDGNFTFEGGGSGTNRITGGTGKYAGASGGGPWKCKAAGTNAEFQCAQRLDYRLP